MVADGGALRYDVLVVGPNPAVDTYYSFETLDLGQVNRVSTVRDTAGGKANNLARALLRLGGRPLVVGIAAGQRGAFILNELAREGLDHDYALVEGNTRLNATLWSTLERLTTVLLEPGPPVALEALELLVAKVAHWTPSVDYLVLTGSLPTGAEPGLYARLIRQVAGSGVFVAVDAAGEALRLAAQAGPSLVKVNLQEFESAFPGRANDWGQLWQQYQVLTRDGLQMLCLTAGAHGALVLSEQDQFWVQTDVSEWVSTVGAGDTFLAGLLFGLRRGDGLRAAACLASAAASANLQVLGCGFIEPEAVKHYLAHTQLREAEAFMEVAV